MFLCLGMPSSPGHNGVLLQEICFCAWACPVPLVVMVYCYRKYVSVLRIAQFPRSQWCIVTGNMFLCLGLTSSPGHNGVLLQEICFCAWACPVPLVVMVYCYRKYVSVLRIAQFPRSQWCIVTGNMCLFLGLPSSPGHNRVL